MTNSTFGRTVATLACTLVFSATAIIGAVGPAQAVDATAASATTAPTA